MRSVAVRSSSRALSAVVRSSRSWSFSGLVMGQSFQTCRGPTCEYRCMSSVAGRLALGTVALGAACVAYGAGYEVRSYRLRRVEVPVLAPGAPSLRVLHLSDLHL